MDEKGSFVVVVSLEGGRNAVGCTYSSLDEPVVFKVLEELRGKNPRAHPLRGEGGGAASVVGVGP